MNCIIYNSLTCQEIINNPSFHNLFCFISDSICFFFRLFLFFGICFIQSIFIDFTFFFICFILINTRNLKFSIKNNFFTLRYKNIRIHNCLIYFFPIQDSLFFKSFYNSLSIWIIKIPSFLVRIINILIFKNLITLD